MGFSVCAYQRGVTLTELAKLLVPAFLAYQPIKKLAKIKTYVERSMAAGDRYFDLIDTDTGIKEAENPTVLNDFTDEIKFNNVVFSYEDKKIIKELNLTKQQSKLLNKIEFFSWKQALKGKNEIERLSLELAIPSFLINKLLQENDVDKGASFEDACLVQDYYKEQRFDHLASLDIQDVSEDTLKSFALYAAVRGYDEQEFTTLIEAKIFQHFIVIKENLTSSECEVAHG